MNIYGKLFRRDRTPQDRPIPGSTTVPNSAGGYTFEVDEWTRLDRFLILGTEGGTYYATERALTVDNAAAVVACLAIDPARTVERVVAISESGRAPKNGPSVLAIAIAAGLGNVEAVADADALRKVARTPTDLFAFVAAVKGLRGWGPGLRRLVADWYSGLPADRLGYLLTKYARRDGWTHRDLFRLVHPKGPTDAHRAIYRWVVAGPGGDSPRVVERKLAGGVAVASYPEVDASTLPTSIVGFEAARKASSVGEVIHLIRQHGLVREHLPGRWLAEPEVWGALLDAMPAHALIRNLGKMGSIGLLAKSSKGSARVVDRLEESAWLRRSRVHPIAILLASAVYRQGHGDRGKLAWTPVESILKALDGAFQKSFGNVEPTGKRRLLAIDVSGSMASTPVAGSRLTCREAAAAIALIVARTEPGARIVAFSAAANGFGGQFGGGDPRLVPVDLSGVSTVAEASELMSKVPMGGTDCSLPMRVAQERGWKCDSFEVYTDNETWAGPVHPVQALGAYRRATGIAAKLVVQAFTPTPFSIADPADAGSLDLVGLDAAGPSIVADFIRDRPDPPT